MAMTNEKLIDPLKELLAEQGLEARWDAGRLLNKQIGLRAEYEKERVKKLAKGAGVSESFLAGCRLLARHWGESDIRMAVHHGVSVRRAFKLVLLDAQAQRLEAQGKKAKAKQVISERKKLVRGCPKPGARRRARSEWAARLQQARQEARAECSPGLALRPLLDARRAIMGNLGRALKRLEKPGFKWPPKATAERGKAVAEVASVQARIERLFDKLQKGRSVEK